MKHKLLGGFSFIEVIMTVAILIIISMVAVTYTDGMKDKTHNSKIISEVQSLENSFKVFVDDTKTSIIPSGNRKYFTQDTGYAHDEVGAFGVSGFVTDTTIPKQYINYLPKDPRSGQYYALASTFSSQQFEIAGIIKHNNTFQARLSGNYVGDIGPRHIIREYNGPNFVFDGSMKYLPYNPTERIMTAKIHSLSGSVSVNNVFNDVEEILSLELFEGDVIEVGTGSFAEIYFSDGSISTLGDEEVLSQLKLSQMRFPQEHNLFTQVRLALNVGSIWTKASKLSEQSVFEVYTTESVAAVRGTIFGVRKTPDQGTNTVVIEGDVEIRKYSAGNPNDILEETLESLSLSTTGATLPPDVATSGSIISVVKNTPSLGVKLDGSGAGLEFSTGAINTLPPIIAPKIKENASTLNENISIELISLEVTAGSKELIIGLTPTLKTATRVQFDSSTGAITLSGSTHTFTGSILTGTGISQLKLCDNSNNCTAPLELNLAVELSYVNTDPLKRDAIGNHGGNSGPVEPICNGLEVEMSDGTTSCGEDKMGAGWEVTHFAPFDVAGDLNMYKVNEGTISPNQNGILENSCFFKYNSVNYPNIFYPGICELLSHTGDYLAKLRELTNSNYDLKNSWLSIKNSFTGIVLDNNSGMNDFLKYEFDPSVLSGDFAIEMQVRAEALKRTSGKYYLLDGGSGNKLELNGSNLRLYYNGGIQSYSLSSFSQTGSIKIQLIQDTGNLKVKINSSDFISISGSLKYNGDSYYIGSQGTSDQWNDVIDYVKIYKKSASTLPDVGTAD